MQADAETLLVELLAAANSLWAAARPFFAPFGVSEAQFNVLQLLARADKPLSQQELSAQLLTDKSAVTGLVDRMEKKLLLRRVPSPGDRRVRHLQLTTKGLALWRRIRPHYLKEIERLFADFSKPRREELRKQLRAIQSVALARAGLDSM